MPTRRRRARERIAFNRLKRRYPAVLRGLSWPLDAVTHEEVAVALGIDMGVASHTCWPLDVPIRCYCYNGYHYGPDVMVDCYGCDGSGWRSLKYVHSYLRD